MSTMQEIVRGVLVEKVSRLENLPTLIMIQVTSDSTYYEYYKDLKKDCKDIGIDLVYFNFDNFFRNFF